MTLSFYDATVPTYVQILNAVAAFMDKGKKHCGEANLALPDVVDARLIDDMAPFRFQIVSVAHHSKGALEAVKSGVFEPPSMTTTYDYDGLQALVAGARDALQAQSADELNAKADGKVEFRLGGRTIPFTAPNFLLSFSLPNFFFHATTAYDLLRAKGAPLGKRDFLGALRIGA